MKRLPAHESNVRSIKNYQDKKAKAQAGIRPALHKVIRAVLSLKKRLDQTDYCSKQLSLIMEASDKGIAFRQPKQKKPKCTIRAIDL